MPETLDHRAISANRPDLSGTLTISRLDPASRPTENFFYDLSRQSECPAWQTVVVL